MQTDAASVENSREFLKRLKMEGHIDPEIPLLGVYLKNPESPIQNNLCTPMFRAAIFAIVKC